MLIEESRRELVESYKRKMTQPGTHQGHLQRARTNAQHPARSVPLVTFRPPATVPRPATPSFCNPNNNNSTSNQPPRNNNPAAGITCFNCQQLGYYASNCP